MTCYHPVEVNPPGQRAQKVACGRCVGCRHDYAKSWAARAMHEAAFFSDNCFVTLTYDDEHLPFDGGLRKHDLQAFIKELRSYIHPARVSYLACGEYGENFGRPHYHLCLFGYDFSDKKLHTVRRGNRTYTSEILSGIWRKGFHEIGSLTYQSANYTARYVTKKIYGDQASGWYQKINPVTGEIHDVSPEFMLVSTRPAIGKKWFQKFKPDIYPCGYVLVDGKKCPIPRYYKKLHQRGFAVEAKAVKARNFKQACSPKMMKNSTPRRLADREIVKKAALSQLKKEIR